MSRQSERAAAFRALHERSATFIMPNPWDIGSAQLLEELGFPALATTSAGYAHAIGLRDGEVTRDVMLRHCREIASATSLPVNGDLGNGFGDDPETVAETIRLAAESGLAGGSIEDARGAPLHPIYDRAHAVERVHAAVEAARALPVPFVLTARAENFLHDRADLDDTLERLRAFEAAGADVLYAPGLTTEKQIRDLFNAVQRPINILAGMPGFAPAMADLERLGVRRVSLGSSLSTAVRAFLARMGREMLEHGTFSFVGG